MTAAALAAAIKDAALAAAINDVTLSGLSWGAARIGETASLFDAETQAIAKAVPFRHAEFVAGRLAARRALAGRDHPPVSIPMARDRAPVWPDGLCGSLSHADGWAIAVVGSSGQFLGLGVDLEPARPLDDDVIPLIADPTELVGFENTALAARRIFGAKEAIFKAQYPSTKVMFGFDAVRVDLGADRATFTDHPDLLPLSEDWKKSVFSVWQSHGPKWILSLCAIPPSDQAEFR